MSDVTGHGSALVDRDDAQELAAPTGGISRRTFIGWVIAGPILIAGVRLGIDPTAADASVPTVQVPVDYYDLSDALTDSQMPTMSLLTVSINADGTASFALPRAEVGQGLTTSFAMIIADEIGLPLDKVTVTLEDANPLLLYNQLTGGSNSTHALYTPVRMAAATARGQLLTAAAAELGGSARDYTIRDGVVSGRGRTASVASLSAKAAVSKTRAVEAELKAASEMTLVGTAVPRVDAYAAVTGQKQFAMDIDVPGAMPTMLCRAPTINAAAVSVKNTAQVLAMPGITDVAIIPHSQFIPGGVAVRGQTFGHCIDAVDALDVVWGTGPVDGQSQSDVLAQLQQNEIPLTPALPGDTLEQLFTFNFRPGDALETNCAIANVTADSAEIWSSLKSPIFAQEQIALNLGLSVQDVTVHVAQGGGSFGRHLFSDAALEAAACSRAFGNKPVKLMWHRTDNFRQGRTHPMSINRVRITYSGSNVLALDQRHTAVPTDLSQGFGEAVSANLETFPDANFTTFAETVWTLTANCPYNFGNVTQLLNEVDQISDFNTSSVRNVYSPDACTAIEVMVDQVAKAMGMDPYQFRLQFLRDSRTAAVLAKAAQVGNWGRKMSANTAQGVAVHKEYKGAAACLVEIDCTPATVNRVVKTPTASEGSASFTGPRVTKAVYVVDVGLPINTLGIQAQMMGGIMDGIAQALTYSLHLKDGAFLEGSWDNAFYTRQWNVPLDLEIVVMPATTGVPGGAGEFGVAASMAATACAYARATGTIPTTFPINYDKPLPFTAIPYEPPLPEEPTDGIQRGY